jgi:hypothetical protein
MSILYRGSRYIFIGGDHRTNILVGEGATLNIDYNVGISNSTIICHEEIVIENDV